MFTNLVHSTWLLSIILTVTVECAVAVMLLWKRPLFVITTVFLLNLFTQPLATIAVTLWSEGFYVIELGVILLEAVGLFLLMEYKMLRSLALAVGLNSLTIVAAVLLGPALDLRHLSPLVHEQGSVLLAQYQDPVIAARHCSDTLMSGCVHGVVMEYVDQHFNERSSADWLTWCQDHLPEELAECEHGVGHSFLMNVPGTLNQTLALCNGAACASGVFMEVSLMGPDLPCHRVADEWKATCYASAGSYRQYLPGKETVLETEQWCRQEAGEYVEECLEGLRQRLALSVDN